MYLFSHEAIHSNEDGMPVPQSNDRLITTSCLLIHGLLSKLICTGIEEMTNQSFCFHSIHPDGREALVSEAI